MGEGLSDKEFKKIRNTLESDDTTHSYRGLTLRNTLTKDILKFEERTNFFNELKDLARNMNHIENIENVKLNKSTDIISFNIFGTNFHISLHRDLHEDIGEKRQTNVVGSFHLKSDNAVNGILLKLRFIPYIDNYKLRFRRISDTTAFEEANNLRNFLGDLGENDTSKAGGGAKEENEGEKYSKPLKLLLRLIEGVKIDLHSLKGVLFHPEENRWEQVGTHKKENAGGGTSAASVRGRGAASVRGRGGHGAHGTHGHGQGRGGHGHGHGHGQGRGGHGTHGHGRGGHGHRGKQGGGLRKRNRNRTRKIKRE